MKNELQDLVIEELFDRHFDPEEHEAYAWCNNLFKRGRVRDYFQKKLNELDWDLIESQLKIH